MVAGDVTCALNRASACKSFAELLSWTTTFYGRSRAIDDCRSGQASC
jgi:hypothetical protein